MKKRWVGWLVGVAVGFVALVVIIAVYSGRPANRVIVRNSSGSEVRNIELTVRKHEGHGVETRKVVRLGPGESLTVRHGFLDFGVEMQFAMGGLVRKHAESYVDLWHGEGWVVEIRENGVVASGYETRGGALEERGEDTVVGRAPGSSE